MISSTHTQTHSSFFNLSHPTLNSLTNPISNQHNTHSPSTISPIITHKSFILPSMSCIVSLCVLTTSLHPSSHQIEQFLHLIIKPSTSFQSSHISCPKHNSFNPTHFDNHSLIKTTQQPSFPPSIPLFLHPPLFKHSFLNLIPSIILSITIISFLPFSPSPLIIPLFLCLSHLFIPTLIIPFFQQHLVSFLSFSFKSHHLSNQTSKSVHNHLY